jgi:hypothetical protein
MYYQNPFVMKTTMPITRIIVFLFLLAFVSSCSEEEETPDPSIVLDQTEMSAKTGDSIEVTASVENMEQLGRVVVEKHWDGSPVEGFSTEFPASQISDGSFTYTAELVEEDADHVVLFAFKVFDKNDNQVDRKDLVVEIELSRRDLLTKYDWLHTEDIETSTGEAGLADSRKDDLWRFREDSTWTIDFGQNNHELDGLRQYCAWKIDASNPDSVKLITTYYGFLATEPTQEVYKIDRLNKNELYISRDFDFGGEVENVQRQFAAQPQSGDFVPYRGVNPAQWADCQPID